MTPVFRVVYHTGDSLIAGSRLACLKHIAPKAEEILEKIITETEDTDAFCDDCREEPIAVTSHKTIGG